jgi:hypothetical protein
VLEAGPKAAADVLACVLADPRWDRQVEQRDGYYAQLLVSIGADIEPIRERVLAAGEEIDEPDFWLPIGVLAEMCRRGHQVARHVMASAVGSGRRWRACLDALEAAGGEALIDSVIPASSICDLLTCVDVAQLADAIQDVAAPWNRWSEELPSLRFATTSRARPLREPKAMSGPVSWIAARIHRPADPANLASLGAEALLEQLVTPGRASQVAEVLAARSDDETTRVLLAAAETGRGEARVVALRVLGGRGCTDFVAAAEEFLRNEAGIDHAQRRDHRTRRAFLRYLEALPASTTLRLARQWFAEPWPLSLAAEHILARHATHNDRAMLEAGGADALEANDMYRLCSVVDALSVAGPEESLAFLSEVYTEAPYSYARRRVVSAMTKCASSPTVNGFLAEALWDCESESRELACFAAWRMGGPPARRVLEMSEDPYEDEEVRDAACLATKGAGP